MHSKSRFIPQIFFKNRPIHLTLFVTRRCNARCPFCFYLMGNAPESVEMELSVEEYGRISKNFGSLLWLAFSGGEIFLRDDIDEISRVFYLNNKPSIMLYPTNGIATQTIFEKINNILEQCPKSIIVVKLSLDGTQETHDRLRGIKGSYQKMHQTLDALLPLLKKHRNLDLGINTVMCSENQDEMDFAINHVKTLKGISTHTISLVRGELKSPGIMNVDAAKYLVAAEGIETCIQDGTSVYNFKGARIKAAQDIIQRRLIHKTITQKRRQLPCYAGGLNLVITENGGLYPCESFMPEHYFGNLRESGFDLNTLLSSPHGKGIIKEIRNSCFCTHECYMMTNILFNPAMHPRLFVETMKINRRP